MPLPSITSVLQHQSRDIEKAVLYPRQAKVDIPTAPVEKKKVNGKSTLFNLLKSTDATSSAWSAQNNKPAGNANDILAYWQNVTKASREEQERLSTRFSSVLKQVRMDGFRQASKARTWPAKVFWLLVIIFMLVTLTYQLVKIVQAYYQSPITTTFTISTPASLALPKVYICYGSAVNRTFVEKHADLMAAANAFRNRDAVTNKKGKKRQKREAAVVDGSEIVDVIKAHARWVRNAGINEMEEFEEFDEIFRNTREAMNKTGPGSAGNGTGNGTKPSGGVDPRVQAMLDSPNIAELIYEFYQNAGYKIDETFLECSFDGYQTQKLDCKDIIRRVVDPNYYLCYVVDLPSDTNQTVPGKGLKLVLNSHLNLYPTDRKNTPPAYAGMAVSVDKQFDPFNWEKTCVTAGRVTKMDLSLTHVHLEDVETPSMIQHCYTDQQASDVFKIFKTNYSRTTCQMDCLFQSHRNNCDCLLLVDKNVLKDDVANSTRFCSPVEYAECVSGLPENDTAQKAMNVCLANCYPSCESYRYDVRASFAKMNDLAFGRFQLPENVTYKHLVDLRISYNRLEYAELIQAPSTSIAMMVANLGGEINLWMGASLISLLESGFMGAAFVVWSFYTKVILRQKRKQGPQEQNK